MTEHEIQQSIRMSPEINRLGIILRMNSGVYFTKNGVPVRVGVKGMSDLLFVGHDRIAWIEVKSLKGKPSKEQLNFIEIMKSYGHRAGIARSVEDALSIIGGDLNR